MDEFALIKKHFAPLAKDFPGGLNLADDAALIDVPPGKELVVTTDAICEGTHFLGTEDGGLIAQKLLRVNLSDLAAKGAKPLCYFVSAMLPKTTDEHWVFEFAKGLKTDQETFGLHLAGGDTTAINGPLSFSLTALGLVDKGTMLKRSGAKIGDHVYVSGTLGDAALGLMSLNGELDPSFRRDSELEDRYFIPEPRLTLGQKLVGIANACMDISDGLAQDMDHICAASKTGAIIMRDTIPLSKSAGALVAKYNALWERILAGGDDYELLFTAPAKEAPRIEMLSKEVGVLLTRIGEITKGSEARILDKKENPVRLARRGFSHFS